ncbi:hypothetical protein WCP94_001881 [Bilophila wadsworthia]
MRNIKEDIFSFRATGLLVRSLPTSQSFAGGGAWADTF